MGGIPSPETLRERRKKKLLFEKRTRDNEGKPLFLCRTRSVVHKHGKRGKSVRKIA